LLLAKTAGRNRAIAWDASVTTGTSWRLIDVGEVAETPSNDAGKPMA
jgi:hypothetical protein